MRRQVKRNYERKARKKSLLINHGKDLDVYNYVDYSFSWAYTDEGFHYWYAVCIRLADICGVPDYHIAMMFVSDNELYKKYL